VFKLILILIFTFITACSLNDKDDFQNYQNLYENNTFSDEELFKIANNYISNDEFDKALIELDKIEVIYPSSKYANKSILLTAYVYFLKRDYEKTRAISESYKKYYPGSPDIVYANYLEAMTYYVLIKKSDYSQKNTEMALEKFTFLLNAYPNNKYEIDIITKIQIINNNLAKNKLNTAKFYLSKTNYSGALIYLLDIFNNHSSSHIIQETLHLITKIYYDIEEFDLAIKYASILAYNFPNNKWYDKTYNLINGVENLEDKNWFNKYNPIKILSRKKLDDNTIQVLK
tara:strand:+ start:739 stop:1599 length:861 start_codon:yes stop_codon:yes gene_type:complete